MTKAGVTLADVGEVLPWPDLRDFINHLPAGDSALYRARYPRSWWWTPDLDFMAALLNAVQWGNWQRGGGKGEKPSPVKRPKENPRSGPKSSDELADRKKTVRSRRAVSSVD
jgi:hypothetical protein